MRKIGLLLCIVICSQAMRAQDAVAKETLSSGTVSVPVYDFANFSKLLEIDDDSVYVFNFWATWCAPCIKELPYFEKLPKTIGGKNIKVVLVSLDMLKEARSKLLPFIARKKLSSKVVLLHETDADAWISKIDPDWTGALPATLILSKQNRAFYEQSFTQENLNEALNLFINSN